MVLEHLFPEDWLEKRVIYAFIIAVVYSVLGIAAARLLFGANAGIVSVIFTSLFILPYLQKLFKKEEKEEEKQHLLSLKSFASIKHFFKHNKAIKVYFAIFLGIYLSYMFFSFILPQLGFNTFDILKEQLFVDPALRGRAIDTGTFFSILTNNWWVLLACFLIAIIVGDGAIFFIAWNASSWGVLFGYRALTAGLNGGVSPWYYLLLLFLITLPHVILEGGAYILAAISGNVISDEIIKEKSDIKNFIFYLIGGVGLMLMVKIAYDRLLGMTDPVVFSLIAIILITAMVHVIIRLFQQTWLQKVFKDNYYLFIIAIIIFILGALVETWVLNNSTTLNNIYALSMAFS
jgi:uncharacterized membrane protein SpoIIM required for sporulation